MPRKKKANGQAGICPSNLSQMQAAGRLGLLRILRILCIRCLLGLLGLWIFQQAGKLKQLKRQRSWPGRPDAAFSTINYWPLTDSRPCPAEEARGAGSASASGMSFLARASARASVRARATARALAAADESFSKLNYMLQASGGARNAHTHTLTSFRFVSFRGLARESVECEPHANNADTCTFSRILGPSYVLAWPGAGPSSRALLRYSLHLRWTTLDTGLCTGSISC